MVLWTNIVDPHKFVGGLKSIAMSRLLLNVLFVNLVTLVISSPLSGVFYEDLHHASPKFDSDARIAIIRGGMSGILFYNQLSLLGYSNVTILESASSAGGMTQTSWIDGKPFDWQAHLTAVDHFGPSMEWTATGRLLKRYPMEEHFEDIRHINVPLSRRGLGRTAR